jgi:hypothetical protein
LESSPFLSEQKRRVNERRFGHWEDLPSGGRRYWYDLHGRLGWWARYVKTVDANEVTLRFLQEIYNERSELVEVHEKYPENRGHQKIERE